MASYSTNLLLSLLANGESGVHGFADWGEAANSNLQFLEDTVTETSDITVNTGDVTLSAAQERSLYLNLSGTLTGNRAVETNDRKGMWLVYNGCTLSGNTLTFKTTSGTGATLVAGEYALFVCDGTNAIKVLSTEFGPSEFADNVFRVQDNSDATKELAFELSGFTTATTRTVTWPDADLTVVGTTTTQTLTNKTLTQPTLTLKQSAGASPTASGDAQWDTTEKKLVVGDGTNTLSHLQTGKWAVPIPATALIPATTSGPEQIQREETTNAHNTSGLAYDASSDEYATLSIRCPPGVDPSSFTYQIGWTTSHTGTNGVAWAVQAVGVADGDAMDVAYGTPVVVTDDAQGAAYDDLFTAESGTVTVAGSPVAGESIQIRVFRDVSDGNDDMTEDAILKDIMIYWTVTGVNDA